jgi:hypothetical protein
VRGGVRTKVKTLKSPNERQNSFFTGERQFCSSLGLQILQKQIFFCRSAISLALSIQSDTKKERKCFCIFFAGEAAAAADGKNDFDQKVMKMKNRRKDRMTSLREMSEDICPYGVQHNFYASKNDDNRIKAESKGRGRSSS